MEMICQSWRPGTEEFVPHHILADYIQESAEANGIVECISFNTRVNHVRKVDDTWEVEVAQLNEKESSIELRESLHVRSTLEHYLAERDMLNVCSTSML